MAKAEAAVAEKEPSTAVSPVQAAGLPAELAELVAESTGQGVSRSADDVLLPFISLLQALSPEIKKRDAKYVEGAEEGCMLNKASGQLWTPDEGFIAIPIVCVKHITEWVPREDGGGYRGRHARGKDLAESMRAAGAVEKVDPKDPSKTVWVSQDGKYQFIDTRYQYLVVEQPDGRLTPAVINFSSTGHTVQRAWNTLMTEQYPGSSKVPDAWQRRYRVRSVPKKNNKGQFYIMKIDYAAPPTDAKTHWVLDKAKREYCQNLYNSIMAGTIRAGDEDEVEAEGGDGAPRDAF